MRGGDVISVLNDGPNTRLVLQGRLTIREAVQLHQTALDLVSRKTNLTVCCAGVEHLDVTAIQILLCLGREIVQMNLSCDITGVTAKLREIFRLAGLANALPPEPSSPDGEHLVAKPFTE
jgi:anti-anti-sigma factor